MLGIRPPIEPTTRYPAASETQTAPSSPIATRVLKRILGTACVRSPPWVTKCSTIPDTWAGDILARVPATARMLPVKCATRSSAGVVVAVRRPPFVRVESMTRERISSTVSGSSGSDSTVSSAVRKSDRGSRSPRLANAATAINGTVKGPMMIHADGKPPCTIRVEVARNDAAKAPTKPKHANHGTAPECFRTDREVIRPTNAPTTPDRPANTPKGTGTSSRRFDAPADGRRLSAGRSPAPGSMDRTNGAPTATSR